MLLPIHAAATWLLFGVILIVQRVHYPLFSYVRTADYKTFQAAHMRRITGIVGPAMAVELATAAWIVWAPPPGLPPWMGRAGLALVLAIWGTTGLVQVPLHTRLTDGFDAAAHRRLVATNWLRTVAWALRAGLALWMLGRGPTP